MKKAYIGGAEFHMFKDKKSKYKSEIDRTFIAIRRKTKILFNKKADGRKMSKIDFMDFLVNLDK